MSLDPRSAALIVDVDGVVSPIGGPTAWGDDVPAGHVFGPVLVSPTLCRRLDRLAAQPHLITCWLTSWPSHLRAAMHPFPGRDWPEITSHPDDADLGWWKWSALTRWLNTHTQVRRLAWCDDQLTDDHLLELHLPTAGSSPARDHAVDRPPGLEAIRIHLTQLGVGALLVAPRVTAGITPDDLGLLERFLLPPM